MVTVVVGEEDSVVDGIEIAEVVVAAIIMIAVTTEVVVGIETGTIVVVTIEAITETTVTTETARVEITGTKISLRIRVLKQLNLTRGHPPTLPRRVPEVRHLMGTIATTRAMAATKATTKVIIKEQQQQQHQQQHQQQQQLATIKVTTRPRDGTNSIIKHSRDIGASNRGIIMERSSSSHSNKAIVLQHKAMEHRHKATEPLVNSRAMVPQALLQHMAHRTHNSLGEAMETPTNRIRAAAIDVKFLQS